MIPLINGKAYDYASVQIVIAGVPLASVAAVTYTETQEKVNNIGIGEYAHSRGKGTKEFSASVDIAMNEVELLRNAITDFGSVSPNFVNTGSLTNLPMFDIIVIFNPGDKVAVHTLKNCEFGDDGVEGATGDGQLARSFAVMPSHILYQ